MRNEETVHHALLQSCLFNGIDAADCRRIEQEAGAFPKNYEATQLIMRLGEKNSLIGIVASGVAEAGFYDERGGKVVVNYLSQGDIIGLSSALSHSTSRFQVRALKPCRIIWLRFGNLLNTHRSEGKPSVRIQLMRNASYALARETQLLGIRLQTIAQNGLRERLKVYLIERNRNDPDQGIPTRSDESKDELPPPVVLPHFTQRAGIVSSREPQRPFARAQPHGPRGHHRAFSRANQSSRSIVFGRINAQCVFVQTTDSANRDGSSASRDGSSAQQYSQQKIPNDSSS